MAPIDRQSKVPAGLIQAAPSRRATRTPTLQRLLLALLVGSVLPATLVAVIGVFASFVDPSALPPGQALGSVVIIAFVGAIITAPFVLILVLPAYLAARRLSWATPRIATLFGALIGAALLSIIVDAQPYAAILGTVVGGVTGWVFLSIVGASTKARAS